jgi:hypothetical protein
LVERFRQSQRGRSHDHDGKFASDIWLALTDVAVIVAISARLTVWAYVWKP